MNEHQISLHLEMVARRALGGVERSALGGVIDADFIDAGGAYTVMVSALSPHYQAHPEQIDHFLSNHSHLQGKRVSEAAEEVMTPHS